MSPFLCALAGSTMVVVATVLPFIVHEYSKTTVSPSASEAVPGVQVRTSRVLGLEGTMEALVTDGAVLAIVKAAVSVGPKERPSVGVTVTDQSSPLVVADAGSTDEVLAVESTPFLYQS